MPVRTVNVARSFPSLAGTAITGSVVRSGAAGPVVHPLSDDGGASGIPDARPESGAGLDREGDERDGDDPVAAAAAFVAGSLERGAPPSEGLAAGSGIVGIFRVLNGSLIVVRPGEA